MMRWPLALALAHALVRSALRPCLWLCGGLLLCGWLRPAAAAIDEAPLKAAIVFNLLLYVQWPDDATVAPGTPLPLCADRRAPLWPHLVALTGRAVRHWKLEVREAADEAAARGCRAWVLEDGGRPLAGRPGVLTIGDGGRAGEPGIVIGLYREATRLQFDVDLRVARRQGLAISSKMLRLAREVRE